MDWESFYPEKSDPPPVVFGGFVWPLFAILGLFFLFIIFWPRQHARSSQKVPQDNQTDILPNSFLIKRTISNSAEDIQNRSTSQLVSQWSTPPPVKELFTSTKHLQNSKSSLLDRDDIHLQFLKLLERMNKKDDLTNLAADLNVIDYRGKETLDQLESSIRFPSLPNLEKENGFEQKASISMTFIPRNPKSLMTLTNRKSFFMKPIITSWCFTNFQNRTEKLLKSQYYLGETGFFENYLNHLRRVRSDGDEKEKIRRFKFLPSLIIKKDQSVESVRNDSTEELVEKSTISRIPQLRIEESMTALPNISNSISNSKRNHANQSRSKKIKDMQKNKIKEIKEIKKVLKSSKNQEIKAKKFRRFHSKKRANSKLYYMHHHPVSYANLLKGPQKADLNQITKEILENHKYFFEYIQYEFDSKTKRIETELEDLSFQEKNGKFSQTLLTKKETLNKQLIRIKVKKEAFLMKEMKKIQKLNEQIKQCFDLIKKDSLKQNDSLNTNSNIEKESNVLYLDYDSVESSDTSIMLLYAKAWNELQASLIQIKMNIKKKSTDCKITKRMIAFKEDYLTKNKPRPQSAVSSQWTTETEDNICDLKEASGRIDLNINTPQLKKFPLTQISSKQNINDTTRPCSSNGDLSKIPFEEKPEMIISLKAKKSSQFIIQEQDENENNIQVIKSKKNVTFSEDNNLNDSKIDEGDSKINEGIMSSFTKVTNDNSSPMNDERINMKSKLPENYMNMNIKENKTQINDVSTKIIKIEIPQENAKTIQLQQHRPKSKHSQRSWIKTPMSTFENTPEQEITKQQIEQLLKSPYQNLKIDITKNKIRDNISRSKSQKRDKELDGSQKKSISRQRNKNPKRDRESDDSQKRSVSRDLKKNQKRDNKFECSQKRSVSGKRKKSQKWDKESDSSHKRSVSRERRKSRKRDNIGEESHQKKKSSSPGKVKLKSLSPRARNNTSTVRLLNELSNMINDQTTAARNVKQSIMTHHAQEIKKGLNVKKDQAQNKNLNPYTGEAFSHLNPRWKF